MQQKALQASWGADLSGMQSMSTVNPRIMTAFSLDSNDLAQIMLVEWALTRMSAVCAEIDRHNSTAVLEAVLLYWKPRKQYIYTFSWHMPPTLYRMQPRSLLKTPHTGVVHVFQDPAARSQAVVGRVNRNHQLPAASNCASTSVAGTAKAVPQTVGGHGTGCVGLSCGWCGWLGGCEGPGGLMQDCHGPASSATETIADMGQ